MDEPSGPGPSWNSLAQADSRRVPDYLLETHQRDLGSAPLDPARYTDPAFFALECERMWPNVWQFAAREEELPEAGDYVLYENAGRSYLVTRQPDGSVRAFHNVCLHRGRKLRTESGWASEFQCAYHGFTWNPDGTLKRIPCRWDFPQLDGEDLTLPEAQVGRWGGYIFVKENEGGPTLEEYLAPLPAHFARWRPEDAYTSAWVGKVIPVNWKAAAEAFMEAFHVAATHPQISGFTGDVNSKYNLYGDHVNLTITPFGVLSPMLTGGSSEQEIIDNFLRYNGRVVTPGMRLDVPDGQTARAAMGAHNRARFAEQFGRDLSDVSDAEVQDAFTYNVFPNFSPWGGVQPTVVYRWRPWPDVGHTLMEVRLLARAKPGEAATCAPFTLIEPHESFADHLGQLGTVLEQDMANLPHVQTGMKASKNRRLHLARYQESRIRHFHQTLDKYLARDPGAADRQEPAR
ncbi:aromatic ring-hydroxylating oxygenase subunit alpha [Sphingomonas profundi]|uniref:aromatic ring-hydroxylating oxygenase subunit alpha n=1 Tax=Alterirhizorhabdus profundi TaxID=2681549 RepID=UPI001E29FE01|nr:aromatic ring-hydroxylating dioxygenase subunit alpha [Sphingomonas profundi]